MDMPEFIVKRWEAAYADYSAATSGSIAVARTSARVAAVWRDMANVPGVSWWMKAALIASAEGFEQQARNQTTDAKYGNRSDSAKHAYAGSPAMFR